MTLGAVLRCCHWIIEDPTLFLAASHLCSILNGVSGRRDKENLSFSDRGAWGGDKIWRKVRLRQEGENLSKSSSQKWRRKEILLKTSSHSCDLIMGHVNFVEKFVSVGFGEANFKLCMFRICKKSVLMSPLQEYYFLTSPESVFLDEG